MFKVKYQFTFYNTENKYKPITVTVVPRPQEKIRSLKTRAVIKACAERHWTYTDLMYKYNYRSFKWRILKEDNKNVKEERGKREKEKS